MSRDGAEMWRIDALSPGEGFAGPVTHGAVPPGATQARAAELLVSDTDFSVQVVNVNGTRGSASFRR